MKLKLEFLRRTGLLATAVVAFAPLAWCQTLSDPAVDAFNCRMGFVNIGSNYQFTTNNVLLEGAMVATNMGANCYKFYMGSGMGSQYGITNNAITNLLSEVRNEPSYRALFDMPTMKNYVFWCYTFTNANNAVKNGLTGAQLTNEYNEINAFARYLLTNYNNSGKTFYLGNWETDWGSLAITNYNAPNPSPVAVQGTINYFNIRQKAVDDANAATSHTNVNVYHYAEVVMVTQTINNPPGYNQRCINAVIPYVTNLDYVSWSSYTIQDSNNVAYWMDYASSFIPTNKASKISGKRIWAGEFGWGGGVYTADQQASHIQAYVQQLYDWGCPFSFFWALYNGGQYSDYDLIESTGYQTKSYWLHDYFWNAAKLQVLTFKQQNGRLPTDTEFAVISHALLNTNFSLTVPVSLKLTAGPPIANSATSATLNGTITQGIYGDGCASVTVYWGPGDGGTNKNAWANAIALGTNTLAGTVSYATLVTNLPPGKNYYRYYATNSSGEAWSPSVANPLDYGSRMQVTFNGYNQNETLVDFPVLVCLGTNLTGFSYSQFASPTGGDLRFTDAGGNLIPHEIDEWNTNGASYVWVQMPILSLTNNSLWVYWGNAAATNPTSWTTNGSVWSDGFDLVWHLKETNFPYADSAQQYFATTGTAPASTTGLIGNGCSFDGSSQYLTAGTINLSNQFTVSAWVNIKTNANNMRTIWASKAGGSSNGFALYVNNYSTTDHAVIFETGDGTNFWKAYTSSNAVSFGDWHLITAALDKGAWRVDLYVDGVNQTVRQTLQIGFGTQAPVNLGSFATNSTSSYYFKGLMDEVRVESTARSASWIWANYQNVASNSAFASYATVTQSQPWLSLTANGTSGSGGLVFNWPTSGVGYALYTTTNLALGSGWTLVPNTPVLVSSNSITQWQIAVTQGTNAARFYRLKAN